jgi:glycosyltransferase involved in cell wall biosynthesis
MRMYPNDESTTAPHNGERLRLCYLVTHAMTTRFLRGQLRAMRDRGFDVTLISSHGDELNQIKEAEGVDVRCLSMEREIHPFRDFHSLFQLYHLLRSIRPHILNAGTPKAGLLGMLAAWAARVPVRIYVLHGLRLESTSGFKRRILSFTERLASACAHRVIAVSHSLAEEYKRLGLVDPAKIVVLGEGSSNGLVAEEFAPTPARRAEAMDLRAKLQIAPEEPVIGYIGRLTRDKGTASLVQAFEKLSDRVPNARLLLVGDFENGDPLDDATVKCIRTHPRITCTGFVGNVVPYYHAMNVLTLPSYREGFPNVVLEAHASGLPVVGYRATGVVDAIQDGITGRLVPVGAVDELAAALMQYLGDSQLAANHGDRGRQRVQQDFTRERVWRALGAEYRELLHEAGLNCQLNDVLSQTEARAA